MRSTRRPSPGCQSHPFFTVTAPTVVSTSIRCDEDESLSTVTSWDPMVVSTVTLYFSLPGTVSVVDPGGALDVHRGRRRGEGQADLTCGGRRLERSGAEALTGDACGRRLHRGLDDRAGKHDVPGRTFDIDRDTRRDGHRVSDSTRVPEVDPLRASRRQHGVRSGDFFRRGRTGGCSVTLMACALSCAVRSTLAASALKRKVVTDGSGGRCRRPGWRPWSFRSREQPDCPSSTPKARSTQRHNLMPLPKRRSQRCVSTS